MSSSEASFESVLQYLQIQIGYLTSHFQIADARAAGVVAYVSVLTAFTATKFASLTSGGHLTDRLAAAGVGFAAIAIAAAFIAIIPRGQGGRDPFDPFSFVGLANSKGSDPYPSRLPTLTPDDMAEALADTAETCAGILWTKYRWVAGSVLAGLLATLFQGTFWFVG